MLAEMFPSVKNTRTPDGLEKMTVAYHAVLYDLPGDLLERAALHIAATATFFPSAGELRRAACDLLDLGHDVPLAQDA